MSNPGVIAAAAVSARKKRIARQMVAELREKGAVAEARATQLDLDSRRSQSVANRLIGANVIRRTSAGSYWLDETAHAAYAKRQATRKVWVLAALFVILVGVLLWAYLANAAA